MLEALVKHGQELIYSVMIGTTSRLGLAIARRPCGKGSFMFKPLLRFMGCDL